MLVYQRVQIINTRNKAKFETTNETMFPENPWHGLSSDCRHWLHGVIVGRETLNVFEVTFESKYQNIYMGPQACFLHVQNTVPSGNQKSECIHLQEQDKQSQLQNIQVSTQTFVLMPTPMDRTYNRAIPNKYTN